MGKRDGKQKSAQAHAEGQHGEKTRSALIKTLESGRAVGEPVQEEPTHGGGSPASFAADGHHRLSEDREQHDRAERAAEANRHARENPRGGEQVHGPRK